MTIGERIKIYRKRKNMTQGELAEKIGTTKQNIWNYENNRVDIPLVKCQRLVEVLEMPPFEMMGQVERQQRMLDIYESLSDDGKQSLLEYAEFLKMKEASK